MPADAAARAPDPRRRAAAGQALVLVALSLAVLLGMAAVAIDAGRFLTQRRFVQNAADAAALAAADVVVQQFNSATVGTARQAARDILAIDLAGSPVGAPVFTAADPPVFNGTTTAANLADGIVLADSTGTPLPDTASLDNVADIRVALVSTVDFTFGRVLGIDTGTVSAHARVGFRGDLMPIAVRRYYNPPGPNNPVPANCPSPADPTDFADLAASQSTSCLGSQDATNLLGYDVRSPASLTAPGPPVALVGDGATASNNSSFRGFIALDVRDFQDQTSRIYYNGVTSSTTQNALKNIEAGWVPEGYPGPGFPPVTLPPDPNDQVGIMDGNTAGIVVAAIDQRFNIGDRIICALYDGTVMAIPDFTISPPAGFTFGGLSGTQSVNFKISRNQAFSGQVNLSLIGLPSWLSGVTYTPNPVTPSQGSGTTVKLAVTAAAPSPQIATVWIEGQSGSPYLTAHYAPIPVNVGGVTEDFGLSLSPDQSPASWGDQVTYTVTVTANDATDFASGITLALDGSGLTAAPLPNDSYWFDGVQGESSVVVTPTCSHNSCTATATLTINTTALGAQATYPLVVTGQATNAAGQPVAHAAMGNVLASGTADDSNYIDITGFAVYQITAEDSNTITGEAVSPVEATPDDPTLRAALKPRLIPWS